jgi:hypothetical protein
VTQVILGPSETVKFQAMARLHPKDRFDFPVTLTNKRVFAEDKIGTLLFNVYLKDMDRCELQGTPWGHVVRLILRSGTDVFFRIMGSPTHEDPLATQKWINTISQVLNVMRNQT